MFTIHKIQDRYFVTSTTESSFLAELLIPGINDEATVNEGFERLLEGVSNIIQLEKSNSPTYYIPEKTFSNWPDFHELHDSEMFSIYQYKNADFVSEAEILGITLPQRRYSGI